LLLGTIFAFFLAGLYVLVDVVLPNPTTNICYPIEDLKSIGLFGMILGFIAVPFLFDYEEEEVKE